MKIKFLLFFLLFSASAFALERDPYPFDSTNDANRFLNLTKEIRCVVCQNQNIADSGAPIAADIRGKVYRLILEKKSDAEIKDYLVKRYSEFILLRPRFNQLTFILWAFPFIGLFLSALFLYRHIVASLRA